MMLNQSKKGSIFTILKPFIYQYDAGCKNKPML